MARSERVGEFFALDDDWERPGGTVGRGDVLVTLAVVGASLLVLEVMRALGSLTEIDAPRWEQWLLTAIPGIVLLTRRRFPLATVVAGTIAYWVISTVEPLMAGLLSTQIAYFLVVLGGVAWARSRRTMAIVYAMIIFAMFLWLVWSLAVGQVVADMVRDSDPDAWIPSTIAAQLMLGIINILYFGGAVIGGQVAWRSARQRAGLEVQTETIREQAERLRESAVIDERLRIARELHDVVAHHVSSIGVQAAAARRVMDRDPEGAKGALLRIEGGSRDAVTQMRGLLGTLRMRESPGETDDHAPEPTLADIAELTQARSSDGLTVVHEVVETEAGDLAAVPGAVGHSLYRTAQEALTNVTKHSTARTARVTVRVAADHAEVEVTDDGRPRPGTSGTGMASSASASGSLRTTEPSRSDPPAGRLPRQGADPPSPAGGTVSPALRVLLVDDQPLIRSGFAMMLSVEDDLEVVGEAADGLAALDLAERERPDVIVMDVQMPVMDGIAATREIVARDLGRVIILTTFDADDYLFEALRAGASGFLLKNAEADQLVDALRAVGHGHALLAPEVTQRVIAQMTTPSEPAAGGEGRHAHLLARLTDRELDVLRLIGAGRSNAEIAADLVIRAATVKTHVSSIFAKLDVRDRVGAVILAHEAGVVG